MARNKIDIDEKLEDEFDLAQLKKTFQYIRPHKKIIQLYL